MKKLIWIILIIGYCSSLSLNAQDIAIKDIETAIDNIIPESVNDSTPGLVIGIVKDGELIFSKGYGMANLAYDIPNSPEMVYNTGSVSKQFLGYAFAMLHVQNKLSLDDAVSKYMDNWPEFDEKVTLRHLLTHSSGYREAYTMSNLAGRTIGVDRLSREECLNVIRRQPELEFSPGSRFTYNSTAWVVLAEVLEKVTGMPADSWVIENIFQPLGMNDTQIETFVGDVIENAAESYVRRADGQYENLKSNRAIFGAADIYSSINDMAKWIHNLKTAKVGGEEVNEIFLKPFRLNDGVDSEYALGIGVSEYKGVTRYRHTGGHEAFGTQLSYYPEQDLGIVSISNYGGNGWLNTSRIAELLIGSQFTDTDSTDKMDQSMDETSLQSFTGSYISKNYNRTIDITMDKGKLVLDKQTSFIPITKNRFKQVDGDVILRFETSADNQLTIIDRSSMSFVPYTSWSPSESEIEQYNGLYTNDELETQHKIKTQNGNLEVSNRWIGSETLEVVTKDVFKAGNGFFVKFERGPNNSITGYNINTGRTLNVFFKRVD